MRILLVFFVLCACAGPRPPPPAVTVEFAGSRATYRSYADEPARICNAEPRWLMDELTSVNGMLSRFLDSTAPTRPEVPLSIAERRRMSEAAEALPPILDEHAQNLEAMSKCGFAERGGFPVVRKRGMEYVAQIRKLLDDAPALIEYANAVDRLEAWRRELPRSEVDARLGCPPRQGKTLYFAHEQENGTRIFAFCDGTKVTAQHGKELVWTEPSFLPARERRRWRAAPYLKLVRSYPEEQIVRPPPVPEPVRSSEAQR